MTRKHAKVIRKNSIALLHSKGMFLKYSLLDASVTAKSEKNL
jgi:hypothetical protein